MHLGRNALVAAGVATAAVAGGAAAYAATNSSSTGHDPQSVAQVGHGHRHGGPPRTLPSGMRDVVTQIRAAMLDRAAAIVDPIIDGAVSAGTLTAAQAATARQALADLKAGKRPSADALALLRDDDARAVAGDAFQALAEQVPAIAQPILDAAVAQGTIDQATADAVRRRIEALADHAAQGGLPFGGPLRPGHFGPGRPGSAAPGRAPAGVFGDVAQAIAQQAPGIAGPIIDRAAAAGTITSAQADALKRAAGDLASGGRGGLFAHRDLLADADVRGVVRDVVKAVAGQASAIAKPIVDGAVADGKLTQAQADELTRRIADAAKRAGG